MERVDWRLLLVLPMPLKKALSALARGNWRTPEKCWSPTCSSYLIEQTVVPPLDQEWAEDGVGHLRIATDQRPQKGTVRWLAFVLPDTACR